MAVWDSFLTERDKLVFAAGGYGAQAGFGARPAVLVIDVNYAFCGEAPEPILDSIRTWRNSCGAEAWDALPRIAAVLEVARARHVPIVYTTGDGSTANAALRGRWSDKNRRSGEDGLKANGDEIMPLVAPMPSDIVIGKAKPSAFFGTMLPGILTDLGADSLIITGTTTSGCVRATVTDGFSYNYKMTVVEDCVFDRGQASHAIALHDLDAKYADVVDSAKVTEYLSTLEPRQR